MKYLQAIKRIKSDFVPFSLPPNMTYYLTGDTYHYRDAIRRCDGWWDKFKRRWWISEEGLERLLAELDAERAKDDMARVAIQKEERDGIETGLL